MSIWIKRGVGAKMTPRLPIRRLARGAAAHRFRYRGPRPLSATRDVSPPRGRSAISHSHQETTAMRQEKKARVNGARTVERQTTPLMSSWRSGTLRPLGPSLVPRPKRYPARNAAARGIGGWLKRGRRMAIRYDKHAQRFLDFLYLAGVCLWLNPKCNTAQN